jgi:hypothetical protein
LDPSMNHSSTVRVFRQVHPHLEWSVKSISANGIGFHRSLDPRESRPLLYQNSRVSFVVG